MDFRERTEAPLYSLSSDVASCGGREAKGAVLPLFGQRLSVASSHRGHVDLKSLFLRARPRVQFGRDVVGFREGQPVAPGVVGHLMNPVTP